MFNYSWIKLNTQFGKHEVRAIVDDTDKDKLTEPLILDMFFADSATDQEIEELVLEYVTNLYESLPLIEVISG